MGGRGALKTEQPWSVVEKRFFVRNEPATIQYTRVLQIWPSASCHMFCEIANFSSVLLSRPSRTGLSRDMEGIILPKRAVAHEIQHPYNQNSPLMMSLGHIVVHRTRKLPDRGLDWRMNFDTPWNILQFVNDI